MLGGKIEPGVGTAVANIARAMTTVAGAASLEEQLADTLAAAVEIRVHRKTRRGEQGEIAIAFSSLDELNGLLAKLGVAEA